MMLVNQIQREGNFKLRKFIVPSFLVVADLNVCSMGKFMNTKCAMIKQWANAKVGASLTHAE